MSHSSFRVVLCLCASIVIMGPALLAQMQMPACHPMPTPSDFASPDKLPVPLKLTGIGNLHIPISSRNPETQAWFDQGMNLIFDFWDYEADRAFEQAIRTDPDCAICHWGLAQSLGIHNQEVQGFAHDELSKALALRSRADKREQLYIDASEAEEPQRGANGTGREDNPAVPLLRKLVRKYPTDIAARLLLVEALDDGYDDGKPRKGTAESIQILQQILKEKPDDSAANHLWIHAVEAGLHPEQALHSAIVLGKLAPASGHMTHMPGHIFYRTGDYQRAQQAFDLSTSVDEAYMKAQHIPPDDDWNYVHNLMYSIANLMEEGHMTQAAAVSDKLPAARGTRAASLYPWSTRDSLTRLSPQLPIALRTGNWSEVQKLLIQSVPPPHLPNVKSLAEALQLYARGMQAAASGKIDEATHSSVELDAHLWRLSQQLDQHDADAQKKPDKIDKPANQVQSIDQTLGSMVKNLAIMSLQLRGATLIDQGKIADADSLFKQARREEIELGYHEPPAFIRPVAEQQAESLFQADQNHQFDTHIVKAWQLALEDRPKSGFPLYGLALLTESLGDASKTEAAYKTFLDAWQSADPDLPQLQHAHHWLDAHSQQNAGSATSSGPVETLLGVSQ